MAAIELRRVTKAFANGGLAVQEVTLDVGDGELLVILGPSGSGKSTVLRLMAGLEEPTAGQIFIGGRDVTGDAPQSRDLAMVFQNYALYPHKTVRENLEFGLRVRRLDAAQVVARVEQTARLLGIDALLDRKPAQLSGGQRQRVALGRALVREPQAFLLDEPLSNLDPVLRVSTRAELGLLHQRLRTTTVYVTHDQEEAMTLGTRIAVMRDGRLEQLAPPLDVFRRPANVFVARFVGSPAMNIWRGAWTQTAGGMRLVSPAFALAAETVAIRRPPGGQLDVGIRPHDVELTPAGAGDVDGIVEVVERLGSATLVHLRAGAPGAELVRAAVSADVPIAARECVGLRLRPDRLHYFDADTGQRLS
jgi:multiple sugar transport system ATP-binding protein